METIIRQATKDDMEAIGRFLRHAYEQEKKGFSIFKFPERWIWQFIENPFVDEPDNRLPIWLAIKDNEIVGQMCAISANMKIGDQTYSGGWGCDFIVSRKSRGEGIGHKLTGAYYQHYQVGVGVSMAGSTRRIWEKYDPIHLKPMHIYWHVVKLDKHILNIYLSKRLENRKYVNNIYNIACKYLSFHNLLAKLANILLSIRKMVNPMLKQHFNSCIQEIFEFGDDIENLSESTYRDYDAIVKRESILLNWRFFRNKQLKYRVFILKNNDRLKGYLVVRKPHAAELNIGHIVDFYAAKNDIDTINELLLFAIKFFGNSVSAIKCSTSLSNIEKLIKKYGFIRIEKMRPLVLVSDPALREKLRNLTENWFLTLADQDLDQIRPE